jgi:hypothetical protein
MIFYYESNFTKKKKTILFDKLISSYTLTKKKAQKHATLEFNFTKKKTLFKFALESNAHPNFRDVIWPKKVRITFK